MKDYEYYAMQLEMVGDIASTELSEKRQCSNYSLTAIDRSRFTQKEEYAYRKRQRELMGQSTPYSYESVLPIKEFKSVHDALRHCYQLRDLPEFACDVSSGECFDIRQVFKDAARRHSVPSIHLFSLWKNERNQDKKVLSEALNARQIAIYGQPMSKSHVENYFYAICEIQSRLAKHLRIPLRKPDLDPQALPQRLRYSYQVLRENQGDRHRMIVSLSDVCEMLNVSDKTVRSYLKKLSNLGYILCLGGGSKANYSITVYVP
ncbi:DeoR family transcriptional regulator [Vibrio alginolyticus]|uniref:DeoR family transcriptional regulator n=1 Tax=Vibrio alginolyticus TaxID=663 RepID=UPI0010C1C281|nr:DeoR family transcriptional regulator [Vibrio alginolyticus]MCS0154874.1 DeoR family transcriptional regulator [Vibrio alginolyticus]QCO89131.1 DeoR family transcriptional regulator [Vibrio neocaledonicus]